MEVLTTGPTVPVGLDRALGDLARALGYPESRVAEAMVVFVASNPRYFLRFLESMSKRGGKISTTRLVAGCCESCGAVICGD